MFPFRLVRKKTSVAKTTVTPIVPVMLNPPKKGTNPRRLQKKMKKKMNNKLQSLRKDIVLAKAISSKSARNLGDTM